MLGFDPQDKRLHGGNRYLPAGVFLAVYGERAAAGEQQPLSGESAFGRLFEVTPEGETVEIYHSVLLMISGAPQ